MMPGQYNITGLTELLLYRVFNMDPKALHIFYDKAGPLIAFNRSGSIFFNLRFHLAWHGEEMRQGNIAGALISTYFSMAHEVSGQSL